MNNKNITIKLPYYIENIFQNSSIDGEIDYLKSIFDDRNINLGAFYELNIQIYKDLLINERYSHNDFLKIKSNLFYLYKAGEKSGKVDFIFSKYYNTNFFIKNELEQSGTKFDKFCRDIFMKDSKKVIQYLSGIKLIKDILKEQIINSNFYWGILAEDFLDKEYLFDLIKDIFTKDELIDLVNNKQSVIFDFIGLFLSLNGLDYLSSLDIKKSILDLVNEDLDRRRAKLLDSILESNVSDKFIEYLDIDNYLIEGFEEENDYMLMLSHLLQYKNTIDYLESLGLSKSILKENNRNFDWLIEQLSETEDGENYLESLNNEKINKLLLEYIPYISKKELEQIKKGKIKLEDKLDRIFESEEGIRFLEKNYQNDEISEHLIKTPRLFGSICDTDTGVKFLRRLNLDDEIIKQIKKESDDGIIKLLNRLLLTDEGINYLKSLNKNDILKEDLLKETLVLSLTNFHFLDKYKDLYIQENIINGLRGYLNKFDFFLFSILILPTSHEGIRCIIEADVKKEIRKSLLENKDYYPPALLDNFNDTEDGKQYLKDLLHLETDDIKNQIYDFIKTSRSGSCLLSGYRGTGKTSLLNNVVKSLQNENEEEIIKVIINIPEQKKDENGNKKSFNKNELITRIIREIYHSLVKNGYSKKEIINFQEQYIRTFKQIEDIEGFVYLKKRGLIALVISVLSFSLPIVGGLLIDYILGIFSINILGLSFGLGLDFIKLFSAFILILLNFLIFRTIINFNYKARFERSLYNDDIAEYRLSENILVFKNKNRFLNILKSFIKIDFYKTKIISFLNWVKNIFVSKNRKFVIIIDELDKLLDLDKGIGKGNIDMKDIFDLLGKLKTLFFDNTGAIFFVVTNKDAYNYFLENKHSEDDLVSNIFNKVLYLPMIKKENFNLNRTFIVDGIDTEEKTDNKKRSNNYLNNWLYYKSHGNWRKANFMLNQQLNDRDIILNKENIEYEMKFYNFADILYDLFFQEDKIKKIIIPGEYFYEFIDKFILNGEFIENQPHKDNYQGIIGKLQNGIKQGGFDKTQGEIISKISELIKKYTDSDSFDTFAYMNSSVEKISNQPAYRDFILNNILNIIEILKHDKTLRIEDIFSKLKFCEIDAKYPAFEDLILIYIPFMIYYFNNLDI